MLEWSDWLTLLAILLAPLVAVQVSAYLENRKAQRQRKLEIFRALMTTRHARMAPEHIRALNMIDIEFSGSDADSKGVLNAWKAYLDHLNTPADNLPDGTWLTRGEDLFVDLMYAMSVALDYDYDKTHLRRSAYYPKGYGENEFDQIAIRRGFREVLEGRRPLPVLAITGRPEDIEEKDLAEPQQLSEPAGPEESPDTESGYPDRTAEGRR